MDQPQGKALQLDADHAAFIQGAVPAVVATCAGDGTPNVSYSSEVHYVDPGHVALSYQFFSKTRQNVLENPRATVLVIHPDTGAQYKLATAYLRTEDSGPLFECMKAKLAGIASHAGMTGVFRLRGADVYRVDAVTEVYRTSLTPAAASASSLAQLRCCIERLSTATDLASLLDTLLDSLRDVFDIRHSMVLMREPTGEALHTVASRGYAASGATRLGVTAGIDSAIPFPGLPESQSQVAVPIVAGERLLGVLFAESTETGRFGYDEEDALVVLARHVGTVAAMLEEGEATASDRPVTRAAAPAPRGAPIRVRRYAENDSIFVGDAYMLKGVAGPRLRTNA